MKQSNDLKKAIWLVGIATLIGFYLLGQYYNRMELAVLAFTIIAGSEYFHLKREESDLRNK